MFPQFLDYCVQILVTPARQIDQDHLVFPHFRRALDDFRHGMGRLEGRDDPLGMAKGLKGRQRFLICCGGVKGALGIPLTAGRSIAVDPKFLPLGAPMFVTTTQPGSDLPLQRLVVAQDTGGAIRGPVRADLFFGFGADAGTQAGMMKNELEMWLLWPKAAPPP